MVSARWAVKRSRGSWNGWSPTRARMPIDRHRVYALSERNDVTQTLSPHGADPAHHDRAWDRFVRRTLRLRAGPNEGAEDYSRVARTSTGAKCRA